MCDNLCILDIPVLLALDSCLYLPVLSYTWPYLPIKYCRQVLLRQRINKVTKPEWDLSICEPSNSNLKHNMVVRRRMKMLSFERTGSYRYWCMPPGSPYLRQTTRAKVWHYFAMILENCINEFVRLMAAELNESVGLAV